MFNSVRARLKFSLALSIVLVSVSGVAHGALMPPDASTDPVAEAQYQAYLDSLGRDWVNNQEALVSLKNWILAIPNIADAGFVTNANFAANMRVVVYWAGDSPLLETLLAEGSRRGISIDVHKVKYNMRQLDQAASWVNANFLDLNNRTGLEWDSTALTNETFDGIRVQVFAPKPVSDAQIEALRQEVESGTGVATRVEVRTWKSGTASTARGYDYKPFAAGGLMNQDFTGRYCSSGFALNYGGGPHTSTARHCGGTYWAYEATSSQDTVRRYGSSLTTDTNTAAHLLGGGGSTGSPAVFVGEWNSSANKTVKGYASLSLHDKFVTSGGNSGINFNIEVIDTSVQQYDGFGTFYTIEGRAQTPDTIAVIQGDSGGPAGQPYADGVSFGASGMIQNYGETVSCSITTVRFSAGNICGKRVYITSTQFFAQNIGATLVVG